MAELASPGTTAVVLPDAWEPAPPIPLDGPLERSGFAPLLTAVLALVAGLVLFQGISAVVALVLILAEGVAPEALLEQIQTMTAAYGRELIVANSVGQVLGLALFSFGLARLHSRRPSAFLRLRKPDGPLLLLAGFGLLTLIPVVQWAGLVNEFIPLPESWRAWDAMQMELVENILLGEFTVFFSLAMLAVTPAICEELFFRGYVQRQTERGLGTAWGIVASGVIFGVYHLRPTQLLPLALLGIYLAYVAWRTGSLWGPMLVHFLNNGFAVAAGAYVKSRPDLDIAVLEETTVPWYAAVLGLALFGLALYLIERRAKTLLALRPAPPVLSHQTQPPHSP